MRILRVCSLVALLVSQVAVGTTREWHFNVWADGWPIGTHTFRVVDEEGHRTVETVANFRPKILFVEVYRYDHRDRESWQDGCLQEIDAHTDDNGKVVNLQGAANQDGFRLESPHPGSVLEGCVHTFAYWDKRFLQQTHLLDSQTGEYTDVTITDLGKQNINIRGQAVEAEHYTVSARKFTTDLWYSSASEWLALESLTWNGHRLRYERQ
jgi:hypothetical protein